MNLPAAVLLFALLPVLFGVIVRLALAAGRAGLPGWAWLPIIVLTIPALLAGGAYFVAHAGERTVGIVSGKSESLEIADIGLNPSVSHRLVLTVADDAAPPDVVRIGHEAVVARRGNLEFDVDEALFDACRPGQRIALRRLRLGPLEFARLESEPWWDVAPGWFERVWPVADARAPRFTTAAQVVAARAVRDAYAASLVNGGGDGGAYTTLAQPYDEVRFRFTTPGGAEIVGLDRVDAGSAGSLRPGMSVGIEYTGGRPRTARLVEGRRSFIWQNRLAYWGMDVVSLAAMVVAVSVGTWFWRRVRRRAGELRRTRPVSAPERVLSR